jgi:gamma-glutamylcyclotransferase (GGCT)/AIG2-like uncharacterized protein YtfP
MTRLFVYGTLMRGFGLNHLLRHATFRGEAVLPGYKLLSFGHFPAMVRSWGMGGVLGELYDVDGADMGAIDSVEGHPNFYRRMPVSVAGSLDQCTVADAYVMPWNRVRDRGHLKIPDGNWRTWAARAAKERL